MAAFCRGVLAAGLLAFSTGLAVAADRAIIVLDASGSMWGQIEGKPKLEIARETLRTVLQTVPADLELGLMAYGHRQKGSCTDIELVVSPAAGTASAIVDAVDGMRFLGKTPLSEAVRQAAQSLRYTEDKATVVLITDGIETCEVDPCALGEELERSGIDFTAHVVGFGLSDEEGRQVACLADNTGGKYIQAHDAGTLTDALTQTVVAEAAPEPEPAPPPQPAVEFNFAPTVALSEDSPDLGEDGQSWVFFRPNADGSRGEHVRTEYHAWKGNLESGDYIVVASLGRAETEQRVTIEDGEAAAPHFILNAGRIVIRPIGAQGEDTRDGAAVRFTYPGGETTEYGLARVVVPAGQQKVTVAIGKGEATEEFTLAAGETVEKDIVVGVGRAVANAYYVAGMKVEAGGLAVNVVKAAVAIDGSREEVTYGYGPDSGFDLPPGDYVLVARLDAATAEAPFTVKAGERVNADVVLNAGVLAVASQAVNVTTVYGAAKDIQGTRKQVHYSYDDSFQATLNAGEYVVVTKHDNDEEVEVPVTVKAGERTEITVP